MFRALPPSRLGTLGARCIVGDNQFTAAGLCWSAMIRRAGMAGPLASLERWLGGNEVLFQTATASSR